MAVSKRLALDTNVLFDRANEERFAKDFFKIFGDKGYSFEVPPTVIAELAFFQAKGSEREKRVAGIALRSMLGWGAAPIVLTDLQKSYKKNFIDIAEKARLLPPREKNDLQILAETAIKNIPAFVTSDRALLDVDHVKLQLAFQNAGLASVMIVHPERMVRALR